MEQKQRERRQSQEQYQGEDRRKPDPIFDDPTITPATAPDMDIEELKEEQEKRRRQQNGKQHDQP